MLASFTLAIWSLRSFLYKWWCVIAIHLIINFLLVLGVLLLEALNEGRPIILGVVDHVGVLHLHLLALLVEVHLELLEVILVLGEQQHQILFVGALHILDLVLQFLVALLLVLDLGLVVELEGIHLAHVLVLLLLELLDEFLVLLLALLHERVLHLAIRFHGRLEVLVDLFDLLLVHLLQLLRLDAHGLLGLDDLEVALLDLVVLLLNLEDLIEEQIIRDDGYALFVLGLLLHGGLALLLIQ